jgi:3-hydroxyacyl-[acyl-carrier-protein] dehydratase
MYDKVTKIQKGRSITGVTAFPLAAEYHRAHFSRLALVPGTIMIEAMFQVLGWLIIYSYDFKLSVMPALMEGAEVESRHRPGFTADICAEILSTCETDTVGTAWMEVEGRRIASIQRLAYSHFRQVNPTELADRFRYFSGWSEAASAPPEEM